MGIGTRTNSLRPCIAPSAVRLATVPDRPEALCLPGMADVMRGHLVIYVNVFGTIIPMGLPTAAEMVAAGRIAQDEDGQWFLVPVC